MAVPKRRVSHTRSAKRRTHYKITLKNLLKTVMELGKCLIWLIQLLVNIKTNAKNCNRCYGWGLRSWTYNRRLISTLKKTITLLQSQLVKRWTFTLNSTNFLSRIEILDTDDVISMSDSATDALKRKESTIYKAIELVRDGKADAVVSAGHSGATMSFSNT